MEPREFPAELVGGPKDGMHVLAHLPWWQVARMPQLSHFDMMLNTTPIAMDTGLYEARKVGHRYVVTSRGWYVFDWKGWQ